MKDIMTRVTMLEVINRIENRQDVNRRIPKMSEQTQKIIKVMCEGAREMANTLDRFGRPIAVTDKNSRSQLVISWFPTHECVVFQLFTPCLREMGRYGISDRDLVDDSLDASSTPARITFWSGFCEGQEVTDKDEFVTNEPLHPKPKNKVKLRILD